MDEEVTSMILSVDLISEIWCVSDSLRRALSFRYSREQGDPGGNRTAAPPPPGDAGPV